MQVETQLLKIAQITANKMMNELGCLANNNKK